MDFTWTFLVLCRYFLDRHIGIGDDGLEALVNTFQPDFGSFQQSKRYVKL